MSIVILFCNAAAVTVAYAGIGDERLNRLSQWQLMLAILLAISPFVVFGVRVAPRLLRVRPLNEGEVVRFPLEDDQRNGI